MKFIRKIVVYVLCTTIAALPWHGTARATTTGQKDAAAEAKRLGPSVIGTLKGSTQQYGSDIKSMTPQNQTAKSSLFRGGFQSFREAQHSNVPNGISFRNLWHSRFYIGYFYAPKKTRNLAKWKVQTCPPADRALTFMSGP